MKILGKFMTKHISTQESNTIVCLMSILVIVKIMRIIVHKCPIRLLSLLYARLPVGPGEGAFFMDTCKSFLCGVCT
jgi:hypothetical protein